MVPPPPPPILRVLYPFQQQCFVKPFDAVMAAQAMLDDAKFEDRFARVCVIDVPDNPSSRKNGFSTLKIGGTMWAPLGTISWDGCRVLRAFVGFLSSRD